MLNMSMREMMNGKAEVIDLTNRGAFPGGKKERQSLKGKEGGREEGREGGREGEKK
jgi:hypothetical protein